ncbi:7-alpha-hydroxycholest-4-en-3-one 12-alpha-hydroxylase [Lachnellula hyalina]|uniref:7-alpha-hydroxycholest-4-en-3-one 12-alpha-hydroxylase n=1 Tax=Lachnellula hyalina TaxID=1316788 RepID=A0A8H8R2E0_9HELO|nr:7-alpha-hydroxycholest-4-en-3-one 12-alpha-hydroxylase [Lachnellula hyalina]TVY26205.1 7-alpha-hydroxycholest-4-en-3-one 12-alpha-hydroxylase [Lachnellula hyalina]
MHVTYSTQSIVSFLTKSSWPAFIAFVVVLTSLLVLRFLGAKDVDPEEPPVVRPRIPFVGHMIGLLRHHNNYFTLLRIYIVQSPELAHAAFRQSKTIDFETIKGYASCKAVAFGQHATDVVNFRPPNGEDSYMSDLHQEMYGSLAQGPNLLETNSRVLNYLARSLNAIQTTPKEYPLFRWLRDEYTLGSAATLYGLPNPLSEDPNLIESVWDFEHDLGVLVLDFFPKITAPKGYAARNVVTPVFEKYYNAGLNKNANTLVQRREVAARQWGLTTKEISQAEISIIMAAGTNTVPNAFYMICHIFSQPDLVIALRQEINKITSRKTRDGIETVALHISMLQSHCPLITACFNETLRLNKTGAAVRTVLEDVMLDNRYLLKKGAFVQIPTGLLQSDLNVWGPDAKQFNPQRFLTQNSLPKDVRKAQNQAYMPFGGGKNLCPGRHLAYTEIVAFVAMLVLGFELSTSDGGKLHVPKGEFQRLGVASISPEKDLDILITRRKEFEDVTWEFDTGTVME